MVHMAEGNPVVQHVYDDECDGGGDVESASCDLSSPSIVFFSSEGGVGGFFKASLVSNS